MKIFFGKYAGQEIEKLESSYLLWLIEGCESAEFLTKQAVKMELSRRLSLDWDPIPEYIRAELSEARLSKAEIARLIAENELFKKIIILSTYCKGNDIVLASYLNNSALLNDHLEMIAEMSIKKAV